MSPSPNIENLLRQKQIMDQLNQITSQGTGAAMLGGGANLRQFDDTDGGSQATSTGVQAPHGGGILSSMIPGLKQAQEAKNAVSRAIQNKMADIFNPKDPSVHAQDYQTAQGPQGPMLMQRTPQGTSQPYQVQVNPTGQLSIAGKPQFSPFSGTYTPNF